MTQIDNLTDAANQVTQVVLDDGSVLSLTIIYRPAIQRWSMDIDHPLLQTAGINLCVAANLLRQWRNVVTFGIGCNTTDGADPFDLEDFVNGRASLYALAASDVADVEANVYGGALQ